MSAIAGTVVHPEQARPVTELQGPSGRDLAVNVAGAAFGVFLAAGTGPLAPFLAPTITPLTTRMAQKVAAEWSRKSGLIAETAVQASRLSDAEEFCGTLTGDPEMIALTQKILWAASMTGNEHKLRAFGALLGGAVGRRGERLDETQLLVTTLADLDTPHMIILDVITGLAPDAEGQTTGSGTPIDPAANGWLPGQMEDKVPLEPALIPACLNELVHHGLAGTQATYGGGQRFLITDYGRALATAMHAQAPDSLEPAKPN
jgi:hypothetical protein